MAPGAGRRGVAIWEPGELAALGRCVVGLRGWAHRCPGVGAGATRGGGAWRPPHGAARRGTLDARESRTLRAAIRLGRDSGRTEIGGLAQPSVGR